MNEIEKWLRGNREWSKGIQLLEKYNKSHRDLPICKRAESAMTRPKLTAALRASVHLAEYGQKHRPSIPDYKIESIDQHSHLSHSIASRYNQLPKGDDIYPEEISEAMQTRRRLANERDRIANTLADATSDGDRAAIREKIEELHKEIQTFNHVIGTFQKTGKLPNRGAARVVKEPHLTDDERAQIRAKIKNLRTYISRAKRNRTKWEEDENADPIKKKHRLMEIIDQIQTWTKQKEDLERKLKYGEVDKPQQA